jgi:uncharacterized membrane protein HdeD (DUF308 family)
MTMTQRATRAPVRGDSPDTGKWWIYGLVGLVFLLMGLLVLTHLMAASIVSAIFIGIALVLAGGVQAGHAYWERHWGGFLLSVGVAGLYLIAGLLLIARPIAGAATLTLVVATILVVSGVVRMLLAYRLRSNGAWMLGVSGALATLIGLLIMAGWPGSGLVVLGLFLGFDLMMFGLWWLTFAIVIRGVEV